MRVVASLMVLWKFSEEIDAGLKLYIRCLCFMVCLFCVLFTHNSLLQDGDLIFVEIS